MKSTFGLFMCVHLLILLTEPPTVRVTGALRNVMMRGDLSAHLALDSLVRQPHLYGLGPVAGLQGEIMLFDSKPYVCSVRTGKAITQLDSSAQAAMLVYASVPRWKAYPATLRVNSFAELEIRIQALAKANGLDNDKPFPFRLMGTFRRMRYHVIHWQRGTAHTMDNHKRFAFTDTLNNVPAELLGFYSDRHHGVFTHHSTNMHIHLLTTDRTRVGHLDDIAIDGPVTVYLPM